MRQGDVFLQKVHGVPNGSKRLEKGKRVILKEGEATGHMHEILEVDNIEIHQDAEGNLYLEVLEESTLVHPEHSEIKIGPGVYEIPRQVEYTPAELKNVAD